MDEVFEKIFERLKEERKKYNGCQPSGVYMLEANRKAIDIVKQVAEEHNNGWIPCSEKMPPVETDVLILAKRKFKGGDFKYITTTAMYEDGTVSECNSCWYWHDIEGKLDEENDCYIIPEGWWENKHYNPDECYNNEVDDEVIAWQPLPAPYKKGE